MRCSQKKFLKRIFRHALREVQPTALYRKYLHLFDNTLYYRYTPIPLRGDGRLVLAGSGKASRNMASAILPYLPSKPDLSLLIAPDSGRSRSFESCRGNHPLPGAESLKSGRRMLSLLSGLKENDTLVYLLSGGSSAMMELPEAGLTMSDLQDANRVFMQKGLDIHEINILRSRLSRLKGGKLTSLCKAQTFVFVLSDVVGNDLSTIGSGPFYPPPSPSVHPRELIKKWDLATTLSPQLIHALSQDAPLPPVETEIPHYLIGSNMDLLEAADAFLSQKHFPVRSFPESLCGEARDAGAMIAEMIRKDRGARPAFLLFGGETTVRLNNKPGKGGRSQECALSVLTKLQDIGNYCLLCAGSDGVDGNSVAAGAFADRQVFLCAKKRDLSAEAFLSVHDSYAFHRQCRSLLTTGPSATNVGDIAIAFLY
ncbi:MAG: DUF4147 domain-containing protein [bacterium]|jgi:hydroxypyruvate reductase/glycerate 2-kinase|nr:DUF4147 domain-containing protein [bacterium]